uniref:Uncharacterized protein n=1 Tax=Myripristis murdjan TaxID=586833 RepID=A0A667YZZ7_9TELE
TTVLPPGQQGSRLSCLIHKLRHCQVKFLKMMHHAQRGRMDEQRCSLQPSKSTPVTPLHNGSAGHIAPKEADDFFKIIASSQGRRLDDQRVALPTLPGISGSSDKKQTENNPKVVHVSLTLTKLAFESGSPKALPKSASFGPESEYQKKQNSQGQVKCPPKYVEVL